MAEELRDAVARHGPECDHDEFLDRILDMVVFEDDGLNGFIGATVGVGELCRSVRSKVEIWVDQPI